MTPLDVFYYVVVYFTLYYSTFCLLTFFENREKILKDVKLSFFPTISLIIPAFNEEKNISKTIKSILNQDYPKDKLNLIVVNDGSTDKTEKIVKEFKKVKIINQKHQGKAAALNTGLKHIKTDLVGFIDADSYLLKNALKNMIGYFEMKKVGSVMGTIKVEKPKKILERLQKIEYLLFGFTKRLFSFSDGNYVTPGFALFKTDLLKKTDGFETNNPTEDMEIALKIQNMGFKIKNAMNAVAYTKVPNDFKKFMNQRIRWYRGFIINTRKYSNIIFNPKFGDLGMFVLPINYISLALIFPFMCILFYNVVDFIWDYFVYLQMIGFDLSYLFRFDLLEISSLVNLSSIFFVACIIITGYFLYLSRKYVEWYSKKGGIGKITDYLLFLFVYPLLIDLIWIISIAHEILRVKIKW